MRWPWRKPKPMTAAERAAKWESDVDDALERWKRNVANISLDDWVNAQGRRRRRFRYGWRSH